MIHLQDQNNVIVVYMLNNVQHVLVLFPFAIFSSHAIEGYSVAISDGNNVFVLDGYYRNACR